MVKFSNIKYESVDDVLETRRGNSTQRTANDFTTKKRVKVPAPKVEAPTYKRSLEYIKGYQKMIHVHTKDFHEELLRHDYESSDED